MLIINGKKPARKLNVYVNGKRKAASGGAPANPYQEWADYLDSPVLTADYPYQCIFLKPTLGWKLLICSTSPLLVNVAANTIGNSNTNISFWTSDGTSWSAYTSTNWYEFLTFYQCNHDICRTDNPAIVYFAKTTP